MSIIHPLSCGYAKIYAYELFTAKIDLEKSDEESTKVFQGRVLRCKYERFSDRFNTPELPYLNFKKNFPSILDHIRFMGKKSASDKRIILAEFSSEKWGKLSATDQTLHTVFECKECLKSCNSLISLFPIKHSKYKKKTLQAGVGIDREILRDVANQKLNELNTEFLQKHNTKFTSLIYKTSNEKKKIKEISSEVQKRTSENNGKTLQ